MSYCSRLDFYSDDYCEHNDEYVFSDDSNEIVDEIEAWI